MVLFSQPSKAWTEDDAAGGLVRDRSAKTPSPHQQGQTKRSNSRGGGEGGLKEWRWRRRARGRGVSSLDYCGGSSTSLFGIFCYFFLSTRLNHLLFLLRCIVFKPKDVETTFSRQAACFLFSFLDV